MSLRNKEEGCEVCGRKVAKRYQVLGLKVCGKHEKSKNNSISN